MAPFRLSAMEGREEDRNYNSDDNNGYDPNRGTSTALSNVPNQDRNGSLEGDDEGDKNNSGQTLGNRKYCEKSKKKPNQMNNNISNNHGPYQGTTSSSDIHESGAGGGPSTHAGEMGGHVVRSVNPLDRIPEEKVFDWIHARSEEARELVFADITGENSASSASTSMSQDEKDHIRTALQKRAEDYDQDISRDTSKFILLELIRTLSREEEEHPTIKTAIHNARIILNANATSINIAIETLSEDSEKNRAYNANRLLLENRYPISFADRDHYHIADNPDPQTADTLPSVLFDSVVFDMVVFDSSYLRAKSFFSYQHIVSTHNEIARGLSNPTNDNKMVLFLRALRANVACSNALTKAFQYLADPLTLLEELQMTRVSRSSLNNGKWYETHFQDNKIYEGHRVIQSSRNSPAASLSDTQKIMNLHTRIISCYASAASQFISESWDASNLERAITEGHQYETAAHEAEEELLDLMRGYILK